MEQTKNSLIYEVNLEVEQSKREKYLQWLTKFIEEMLKIDGFLTAEVLVVDQNPSLLSVQYRIENQAKLDSYLNNQQSHMATQGSEFGFKVTSRRVLRSYSKSVRQSTNFGYTF